MKIVVIRHGEVDFSWSRRCTSKRFDEECHEYDNAPIKGIEYRIPYTGVGIIYISELTRSRDTARKLFAGRDLRKTRLINEVPLRSSFDTKKSMPLWFWNISGRIQWAFNNSRQTENRRQTIVRAKRFVEMLCRDGSDCAVITHGFYMHILLREMKKKGFAMDKPHVGYKNGEYVIAVRKAV